ncbi:hypothetical protein OS493_025627 [Desmophyllum pertusum]|uniref:Uncharacterized protein n=1 Tax=Desmophyllum pertusum TaxID=174260 RepID=A0A9W9ZYT2_9CNID|nr:hypothetical protein OS493_025627 [Desmophyllum pertusum]
MEGVESHKLCLIYSVVYSERFVLKGKRKHEVAVGAELKARPVIEVLLAKHAQFKVWYKTKAIISKVASRSTRGAVFFKCVRVDYDKEKGKLKLSEGEIAGHALTSNRDGEDDEEYKETKEYKETMVGLESEDSDLSDSLTEDDVKKLEIIKKAVLIPEKNREKRKQRVKSIYNG